MSILRGLSLGTAITLLVYFVFRVGDILIKGNLGLMGEGTTGMLFVVEMILVLLPMVMLFINSSSAKSTGAIFLPQILVLAGVVLNRMDVLFLTEIKEGVSYTPTYIEFIITFGLVAAIILAYRIAAVKLPIASSAPADH
jgi:Ni/Fe-hydrogenase subunit HybB-like protein